MRPLPRGIRIVFEDRDVLVVDKPAGLLTMGTEKEKRRTLYFELREMLKHRRPPEYLFIVHRLDRDASGLLVFAKTETAKHLLQDQFKDHSARRLYRAVVEKPMRDDVRTIRSYLAENAAYRCYSTPNAAKGQLAITHVRVVRRAESRTWVDVELETGRKHQIRVHLAELGHPIVGDTVYGSPRGRGKRLALHGMLLVFKHPRDGAVMTFDSPPPAGF